LAQSSALVRSENQTSFTLFAAAAQVGNWHSADLLPSLPASGSSPGVTQTGPINLRHSPEDQAVKARQESGSLGRKFPHTLPPVHSEPGRVFFRSRIIARMSATCCSTKVLSSAQQRLWPRVRPKRSRVSLMEKPSARERRMTGAVWLSPKSATTAPT